MLTPQGKFNEPIYKEGSSPLFFTWFSVYPMFFLIGLTDWYTLEELSS